MKSILLSLSGMLLFSSQMHAAVIVKYVPTGSAGSSVVNATTVDPQVTASAIGDIGTGGTQLLSGAAGPIRTTNGSWTFGADGWLFANASGDGTNGTASSTADYFSFSLSTPGAETLSLTSFTFDYGVGTNTTGQSGNFHYAVFASVNGGAYAQIGSTFSTGNLSLTQNVTNVIGNRSVDLSSITGADSVAFRVWVGSTNASASTGSIFQNIIVNGSVVPEPSAVMLGGLGVLVLMRRRRAA
ncbi:PEP-CTERM sorting domain-containing protein [Luteolibacter ambystomatis]|uniref:PEP-CTERM sorting domain-containing protein n=1 Tax=Luteolibacter ambystomatis TaxID=2824561 RepID=A0A975J2R3_9BACT|nr:PEP-CTERM sorting domain-containing protein [Luteolibacter ambystomatis]QUE52980.1 PEP-CTERM sorting domain-containing protein [Luteolibacter ambystomatis]